MLRNALQTWSWRLMRRLRRAKTALAFYRHRLNEEQAYDLLYSAQDLLGPWPLVSIDADLERVRDTYRDQPEFEAFAWTAAERIFSRWDYSDDVRRAAPDWAFDKVIEYATDAGVALIERDDAAEEAA